MKKQNVPSTVFKIIYRNNSLTIYGDTKQPNAPLENQVWKRKQIIKATSTDLLRILFSDSFWSIVVS